MTSVGVMASAVTLPSGVDVLLEPFNNFTFAPWTITATPTIVTGRTGTAMQATSSTQRADYTIPSGAQADTITIGFAWRYTDAVGGLRHLLGLWSDTGATEHNRLTHDSTTGTLVFTRAVITIGSASSVTFTQNTWYYVEVQAKLHDTTGSVIVRINGTEVINATSLDTKNVGTKTVYDSVRLWTSSATRVGQWDDLYITTGAGAPFKGDITVP